MHYLTHSSLSCAKTCLRKYYFSYVLCIEKDRDSTPLRIGKAVHIGLDLLATSDLDSAIQFTRDLYSVLPAWCQTPEECAEWQVECETVVRLLCGYSWIYGEDQSEIIESEQEFIITCDNPATGRSSTWTQVAGAIDKIIKLPSGVLAIREHKTTGDSLDADSDYWKKLCIDQQISMYVLAARSLGYDVTTVEYDVIRKPGIAPKIPSIKMVNENNYYGEPISPKELEAAFENRKESPAMYGARLGADIAERPTFYFARREIPRLDSDIEEFQNELWQMQQLIRQCMNSGWWFKNTNSCLSPYRCEFCDICFQGTNPAERLPEGYRKKLKKHMELQTIKENGNDNSSTPETTDSEGSTAPAAE